MQLDPYVTVSKRCAQHEPRKYRLAVVGLWLPTGWLLVKLKQGYPSATGIIQSRECAKGEAGFAKYCTTAGDRQLHKLVGADRRLLCLFAAVSRSSSPMHSATTSSDCQRELSWASAGPLWQYYFVEQTEQALSTCTLSVA